MTRKTEEEFTLGQMVQYIKGNLKIISDGVKGLYMRSMVINMKGSFIMINVRDMECTLGVMVILFKGNGKMGRLMDME